MKRYVFSIMLFFVVISCFADLTITRNESQFITKEIYAYGRFAEIVNNRIVSIWDFRKMELTLIEHDLKIYTTIDFDAFRNEILRQTQARIDKQNSMVDEAQIKQMAEATKKLYSSLKPKMEIVDTTLICNYPSVQYIIYQDTLKINRLWISRDVKDLISKEIPYHSLKKAENIFKESRKMEMDAVGLYLDRVTLLKERIMDDGYVMRNFDYGTRIKSNPEIYKKVESISNEITEISKMKVDQIIFNIPKNYKSLSYSAYQIALIKANEEE